MARENLHNPTAKYIRKSAIIFGLSIIAFISGYLIAPPASALECVLTNNESSCMGSNLKPNINICCPWGQIFNPNKDVCESTINSYSQLWPEPELNVSQSNGTMQLVNIYQFFVVKNYRPCQNMYALQLQEWRLFLNGTLLRLYDDTSIQAQDYCIVPTVLNSSDKYFTLQPANCNDSGDRELYNRLNAYAMLTSIPFMVLTIAVYLFVPKLRNQHGKSLVCYLLGLSIGYAMLSTISLAKLDSSRIFCKIFAYMAYYFFMSAFFWLSVISFDLWYNFSGTHGVNRPKQSDSFQIYSLYAWGLAAAFLVFTWSAQELTDWPLQYKPWIGSDGFCWLNMHSWSAMIYFFGPIIVIILGNTIMFVLTAIKIQKVQTEMAKLTAHEESGRSLRLEKDRFGLFLRLFILMGVTWSMEILSYFVGSDKAWAYIFCLPDLCNAFQGFLIFVLFVMKKKVKHLITSRYSESRDSSSQRKN